MLALSYKGVPLGTGIQMNTVIVSMSVLCSIFAVSPYRKAPGANDVTLSGRLIPHNGSASELAIVSELFTAYINGDTSPVIAQGLSTLQPDNSTISWLSTGIQALKLTVPFKSPIPINPIRGITIGDLALAYSAAQPWSPVANSHTIQAQMRMSQIIMISSEALANETVRRASIWIQSRSRRDHEHVFHRQEWIGSRSALNCRLLSTYRLALTEFFLSLWVLRLRTFMYLARIILRAQSTSGSTIRRCRSTTTLAFPNSVRRATECFLMSELEHCLFLATDVTDFLREDFLLQGHSHAIANMSIGQLTLDPINFNVSSGLNGFQGLKNRVTINHVDVMGGTTDHLNLATNGKSLDDCSYIPRFTCAAVTIVNPSNLNLTTGDLRTFMLGTHIGGSTDFFDRTATVQQQESYWCQSAVEFDSFRRHKLACCDCHVHGKYIPLKCKETN